LKQLLPILIDDAINRAKTSGDHTHKRTTNNSTDAELSVVNLPQYFQWLAPEIRKRMPTIIDCEPSFFKPNIDFTVCMDDLRRKITQNRSDGSLPISAVRLGLSNNTKTRCWLLGLTQFLCRLRYITNFKKIAFEDEENESNLLNIFEIITDTNRRNSAAADKYLDNIFSSILRDHERNSQHDMHEMLLRLLSPRTNKVISVETTMKFYCNICARNVEDCEYPRPAEFDVSIAIRGEEGQTVNVKNYLENYQVVPERIEDSLVSMCKRCFQLEDGVRYATPEVEIVGLSYFLCRPEMFVNNSGTVYKIPNLKFEMSLSVTFNKVEYRLVSVVYHVGDTTSSGHYFTAFTDNDNEWYIADDNKVRRFFECDEYGSSDELLDDSDITGDPFLMLYVEETKCRSTPHNADEFRNSMMAAAVSPFNNKR
jgi:hypothetical protein